MFGVKIMVHSWVTVRSSSVSSRLKSTPYLSGRQDKARASSVQSWKIARALFFLFAFLILFSGFTFIHTFASSDGVKPATAEELVVSVDSGDTLWHIAKLYKKESLETRQAVHVITQRNGLSSSNVKVGQALVIPSSILP